MSKKTKALLFSAALAIGISGCTTPSKKPNSDFRNPGIEATDDANPTPIQNREVKIDHFRFIISNEISSNNKIKYLSEDCHDDYGWIKKNNGDVIIGIDGIDSSEHIKAVNINGVPCEILDIPEEDKPNRYGDNEVTVYLFVSPDHPSVEEMQNNFPFGFYKDNFSLSIEFAEITIPDAVRDL